MKKMIGFGAVALCAAVACADVTSANVVGYQNKTIPTGGWRLSCNSFLGVGKEKSAMTLGDFIPNAKWDFMSGDVVQFLSPSGGTATFVAGDGSTYKAVFSYVPEDMAQMVDPQYHAGWYQSDELGSMHMVPANEYPVDYGDAFVVITHTANTTLDYSGEVLKGAQDLEPVTGGWNLMGNSLPVDTTLSELTPNSLWDFMSGDVIQFLSPSGGTATFVAGDGSTYKAVFSYVPEDMAQMVDPQYHAGWYQSDELGSMHMVPANTYPLYAGDGFVVIIHTAGTKVQLPAAIAE